MEMEIKIYDEPKTVTINSENKTKQNETKLSQEFPCEVKRRRCFVVAVRQGSLGRARHLPNVLVPSCAHAAHGSSLPSLPARHKQHIRNVTLFSPVRLEEYRTGI